MKYLLVAARSYAELSCDPSTRPIGVWITFFQTLYELEDRSDLTDSAEVAAPLAEGGLLVRGL